MVTKIPVSSGKASAWPCPSDLNSHFHTEEQVTTKSALEYNSTSSQRRKSTFTQRNFSSSSTRAKPIYKPHRLGLRNEHVRLQSISLHEGPKGVINDWRKFKLESLDRDAQPPSKHEVLRQMSSPHRSKGDTREALNRKSMQEYELIQGEDEQFLLQYRKQCMQEMHERLSFGPRFERLHELESGEAFLDAIEKEHRLTVVVVHIYEISVKGCETLNRCLTYLAAEYPGVKFCKMKASSTGASDCFSDIVLPVLLVYKAGELLGNFLCATQQLNAEFHAIDVEAFLNEYGLLPTKYLTAEVKDEEEADVE